MPGVLPSIGWHEPQEHRRSRGRLFFGLTEVFRFEGHHFLVGVEPLGFSCFIFSENTPAKEVHRLKPGILMRRLMVNVQGDVQRQKGFQLILHIRVEVPYLLLVLAAVQYKRYRRASASQVYLFDDKPGKKIIQLLLSLRLLQIVMDPLLVQDHGV